MSVLDLPNSFKKLVYDYYRAMPKGEPPLAYTLSSLGKEDFVVNTGWLYMLFTESNNCVKIGYTSENPYKRACQIIPNAYRDLVYMLAYRSTKSARTELDLHRLLWLGGFKRKNEDLDGIPVNSGHTEIYDIPACMAAAFIEESLGTKYYAVSKG